MDCFEEIRISNYPTNLARRTITSNLNITKAQLGKNKAQFKRTSSFLWKHVLLDESKAYLHLWIVSKKSGVPTILLTELGGPKQVT